MADVAREAEELRQTGLGASRPRRRILAYLRGCYNHPTADQIYSALLPQNPTLSKMTVYNTLHTFTERGLCRDVRIEGGLVRYDPLTEDHAHFKCDGCGQLHDVPMPEEAFHSDMLEGFEIGQRDLFFRGVCPDCIRRKGSKQKAT